MTPEDKVQQAIREHFRFAANDGLRRRMLDRALQAQKTSRKTLPAFIEPMIRRIAMRSPIAKSAVAAAAVIVMAALAISLLPRLATPAYALDQTVEALQNVRFLHLVRHDDAGQIEDERWIEIGMDGFQIRYRQQNPPTIVAAYPGVPSIVIEDGESTAVYRDEKQAVILYDRDDRQFQWVGELGMAFENLRQEGTILEAEATYQGQAAHKVWWPYLQAECYVDPATKLPLAIGDTELSYENPPAGIFDIIIPEEYVTVDLRPGAEPDPLPNWLIAEERVRQQDRDAFEQGTTALIAGEFASAAAHFEVVVQDGPRRNWAWYWLGSASYELGQYDRAIKSFTEVLEIFATHGGGDEEQLRYCNYARGLAYARLGKSEAAAGDLKVCLPGMIRALRIPSAGWMFEYADNPLIRYSRYQPTDREIQAKMINRLRLITGQNFGYAPAASAEENEAAIAAWEQWLADGGAIRFTAEADLVAVPTP